MTATRTHTPSDRETTMTAMEATVLKAIASLKDELTKTINERHDTLVRQIDLLASEHNRALLDQERRNSQFADRERLEDVARNVHDAISTLTAALLRIGKLETAAVQIQNRIDQLTTSFNTQSFQLLGGATGYLVTALVVAASCILTFLLAHAVK